MTIETGGPAFPVKVENHGIRPVEAFGLTIDAGRAANFQGMTLRDYFAIHVDSIEIDRYVSGNEFRPEPISRAKARYAIADAMLAERTK